jgi:site-specific recombinase XerD
MTTKKEDETDDGKASTLSPRVKNRLENLLEEKDVSQRNAEAIRKFVVDLNSAPDSKVSDKRIQKYLNQFSKLLEHIDFSLMDATLDDVQDLSVAINQEDVGAWTKRDRRVCISKFYRTMFPLRSRPERVHDILDSDATDTSHPGNKERVRQYDFIYPKEVIEMSEAADNPRDALLPLFFYLTGARLKTVREVKLKHITRTETHFEISLQNQKNPNLSGRRDVFVTRMTHLLRVWLENHPRSDDPEAYLFCNLQPGYHKGEQVKQPGDKISRKSVSSVLDKLAERIDLEKRNNPHAFRFSMATYYHLFTDLELDEIAEKGGWGSLKTLRGYILELEDIANVKRKEKQGIEVELGEKFTALDKQVCGNCQRKQPPTRDLCECGHALSEEIAVKHAEQEVVMVETNEKGLQGVEGKI